MGDLKENEIEFLKSISRELGDVYKLMKADIGDILIAKGRSKRFYVNNGKKISFKTQEVLHISDVTKGGSSLLRIRFAVPNNILKLDYDDVPNLFNGNREVKGAFIYELDSGFPYFEISSYNNYLKQKREIVQAALQTYNYQK